MRPTRILMVCSGNICRSPMAAVVAARRAADAGMAGGLVVDSAGTGGWHAGDPMDPRAVAALRRSGLDGGGHRARQMRPEWLAQRDLVLAADRGHLRELNAIATKVDDPAPIRLLGAYHPSGDRPDVPDPYYAEDADFDACLALIEACVDPLIADLAGRAAPDARRQA